MEFLEKKLGGGKVASQKQFLDFDRKVLRFFVLSEGLQFIWHYFLADDTIEIREVHFANDGRDSFSVYLRRQKLPETFDVNQPGQNFIGDRYLTSNEIHFDKDLIAYGRVFTIQGVDVFTADYFKTKYGRDNFRLGDIEPPRPRDPVLIQVPPHNGFGNEVDSLGYVYDLIPKKPKMDFFKYVDNDNKILRYTSRLNTKVPEDVDRRFIISFYLANDTISIYEPAQKNSGITEGPFLQRDKYKNVENNMAFITPTDMPMGGDIKINGYNFHILACDDFTTKYLATHTYE